MRKVMESLCLVVAVMLAACGHSGSEYLGKWQHTKNTVRTLEIVRNGENFLVSETAPGFMSSGKLETSTRPATLKDGILHVETGLGKAPITYVEATDRIMVPGLMGGNIEYVRVK